MLSSDLREQRARLHLSQAALAQALGVARNTVARWERAAIEIQHPELIRMALDRLATEEHLAVDKQPPSGLARHDSPDRQRKGGAPRHDGGVPLHDLPTELTSFIGREQEINAARRLLATTPILTLSGAGGSGKTRMALQVASKLCAYQVPGGALAMRFTDGGFSSIPHTDEQGGQFMEGTFELTVLEATGIYGAFQGGHNHMVDRMQKLDDGRFDEFCFCIISQYQFP